MLKPLALRLTRLLFAGLDLCLRFLQARYFQAAKAIGGVPTDVKRTAGRFGQQCEAHGATRSAIVACGIRGVYATECLGGPRCRPWGIFQAPSAPVNLR